jgi:dienelactone hydrolase
MAEKKVPYQLNGRSFEGMIVYDDSVKTKRPAIFVQPDWKGVCADTVAQAKTAAGKDYVMLMADMFGAGYGDKPKTREQLATGMKAVHNDLPFTIACGGAAYSALLAEADKLGLVDTGKKAAIGFCAGGGFALEQARASADPVTPKPMMDALEEELTKAKVDWHIVTFGRGVHSFCDPTAHDPATTQYDEKLCRTSYMLMRDFFAETL